MQDDDDEFDIGGGDLPMPLADEYVDEEDDMYPEDFGELESIDVGMPWYRRLHLVITRAKGTRTCLTIYVLMACICGTLFIAAAFGANKLRNHIAFTVVEALVNLFLLLEVVVDVMSLGMAYFSKLYNVVDFTVTVSCVAFFFAFLEEERNAFDESLPVMNAILLGVRYCFQLFRAMMCAVRGHNSMQMIAQDEVEVHDLELQGMVRIQDPGDGASEIIHGLRSPREGSEVSLGEDIRGGDALGDGEGSAGETDDNSRAEGGGGRGGFRVISDGSIDDLGDR